MANDFSPEMFSGGAVVFNSKPYIDFATQMMARQQARQEATSKYYQDLSKTINPEGMRFQDMDGLHGKVNELQNFWQQQKSAIINPRLDNGKAQSEYLSRVQDAHNYIATSKSESQKSLKLASMFENPEYLNRLTDDTKDAMHLHELSLSDTKHKSFEFEKINYNPKPFDLQDQKQYLSQYNNLKLDPSAPIISYDPKTMMQTITTKSQLGDEGKGIVKNDAASSYRGDPRIKNFVDKTWQDPGMFAQLNEVHKKNYGTDIKSPEDWLAAWTLGGIQTTKTEQKVEADVYGRQMAMENRRDARQDAREDRIDARQQNRLNAQEDRAQKKKDEWVDPYIDNLIDSAKNKGPYKINGTTMNERDIPMNAILSKALEKQGVQPSFLRITEDGNFRPIYLKHDKTGNVVTSANGAYSVDRELTGNPISRDDLKLALGAKTLTKKGLSGEMAAPKKKITPKAGYFE